MEHVNAAHRRRTEDYPTHQRLAESWQSVSPISVSVLWLSPTGIISAGFVEQYQRKSSLSNIKEADIHEIAEIFVDKRFAGKSVEEMEEAEQVTIFLILREDLSILPQKDTILKLNDIIVIRGENPQ